MTGNRNFLEAHKATIVYGASLAILLFLLKWLELRLLVFTHSVEIYMGVIAILFTALACPKAVETRCENRGS